MEKEPKAFRKLRQRLAPAAVPTVGEEGGGDEAEGEEKEEEVRVIIAKGGELDFMPLELNVGEYLFICIAQAQG